MDWKHKISVLYNQLHDINVTDHEGNVIDTNAVFKKLVAEVEKIRLNKNVLFFIGNGASASMSSHFASDFAKNGKIHTQTFTDLSLITAVANDLSYKDIFAEPLRFQARAGDMLVAISSSGSSPNILEASTVARDKQMPILTLSGMNSDNPLRYQGDINIYVSGQSYGIVETCHAAILHHWMDMVA